jgi:ABC-type branched-subunit amino acid transport system substrate-binding protein
MAVDSEDLFVKAVDEARFRWDSSTAEPTARSSVFTSVTPAPVGKANPWVSGGTGTNAEDPAERIVIEPPAGPEVQGRIGGFDPVKIGYLIDIDTGALLGDCLDAVILAVEDALNDGELYRPIEIVPKIARGLPRQAAQHTIRGYEELADEGCLVIIGPYITDNGMALLPATEQRHVPLVSHNGAKPFHSRYGFTIGNGGVSEEGSIMAGWLRRSGHRRVGMVTEVSPGGQEYSKAFRDAAVRNRVDVVGEVFIETNGAGLEAGLRLLNETVKPDALAYCGYGYPTAMFNPVLLEMGWNPPRIMSTALMWYINEPMMLKHLDGWHGVDQTGPVSAAEGEPNPNYLAMLDRFERRFGRRILHAMIPCSYDATRAAVAGIAKATLLTPEGVTAGLETLTMLPVCVGGPRSYLSFGPYDHKGLKGDWLTIRHVVDGRPQFAGYLNAEHKASNR